MNIEDLKDKYDNLKTYQNVKTILKGVNELLGLTPVNYIHYFHYADRFEELCSLMLQKKARTKTELLNKLNNIVGLIRRFNPEHCSALRDKVDALKRDNTGNIPDAYPEHDARPWSEILELLNYEIANNPNKFAKIACICFKHGYCLRIGEIFATTLKQGSPMLATNWLDAKNLIWYINSHKNAKTTGARKFSVTKEFIDELMQYVEMKDYLLIYKSTYDIYGTHLLASISINSFTNTELRNSYEEWNWNHSGRTKEEAEQWSTEVMGHTVETAIGYYTKHVIGRNIMNMIHGPEPHPAHLENPERYGVSGKYRPRIVRRLP